MPGKTTQIKHNDLSQKLQQQVAEALAQQSPLFIHGGKSKLFYGNPVQGKELDVSAHSGVIAYEPSELYITVRAGTRLCELEELLTANRQMLPFEPPRYTPEATIGGAIAAGIAGPRRAYSGAVRDAILGVQIINGDAEIVNYGGQVMKNVAGYDLSRLMVRSQGTLGVILNVSLRLLPKPETDLTLAFEAELDEALDYFKALRLRQLPVSATLWHKDMAYIRLSASDTVLQNARKQITADELADTDTFWQGIRDQQHEFFQQDHKPLWRFSLPPVSDKFTRIAQMNNELLVEWGGAQRWVRSNAPVNIIQSIANSRKGYATLFRGELPGVSHFPPLPAALLSLHKRLKNEMDPKGIFNPDRIYQGL